MRPSAGELLLSLSLYRQLRLATGRGDVGLRMTAAVKPTVQGSSIEAPVSLVWQICLFVGIDFLLVADKTVRYV